MSESDEDLAAFERSKYVKAFSRQRYREKSPHYRCVGKIEQWMSEYGYTRYANFGCGSGLLDRHLLKHSKGILVDHVNSLHSDVAGSPNLEKFIEASLFMDFEPFSCDFGVCCDVMEHIPEHKVEKALENIANRCREVFFQISLNESGEKDIEKYGGHLHLTVKEPDWWDEKLKKVFRSHWIGHVDTKKAEAPWEISRRWYVVVASNRMRPSKPSP